MTAHRVVSVVAAIAATSMAAGCGDNGERCGPGTLERDGICTVAPAPLCGDGTRLADGVCVVDPVTCESGTVLIGNRCVDPARELVIDLEEGPEPNGLAIEGIEPSTFPAGVFALAERDAAFVLHGHLTPFRDHDGDGQPDPDYDTYAVSVAGPVVLDISVDGVGGTQGGFHLRGQRAAPEAEAAVVAYQRYGMSLADDTARRRLLLPAAGTYALVIADTRALAIGDNPPPAAGARGTAGGPSAEYYASITVSALPAAAPIGATTAGTLGSGDVKIVTAQLAPGRYQVRHAMPGTAAASIAAVVGNAVLGYGDEPPVVTADPAEPAEITIQVGGTAPLLFVDAVYNYGPAAEPFSLSIARVP